jgi:hypothetical protein
MQALDYFFKKSLRGFERATPANISLETPTLHPISLSKAKFYNTNILNLFL